MRFVVRVSTHPINGEANTALLKFLVSSFGSSRGNVTLCAGSHRREKKKVRITVLSTLVKFLTILLQRDEIKELASSS